MKSRQLETSSIPAKENFADLGTKKFTQDRMRYLMYDLGVFNENTGELQWLSVKGPRRTSKVSYA